MGGKGKALGTRLTRIRDVEECRFSRGKIKMLDFSWQHFEISTSNSLAFQVTKAENLACCRISLVLNADTPSREWNSKSNKYIKMYRFASLPFSHLLRFYKLSLLKRRQQRQRRKGSKLWTPGERKRKEKKIRWINVANPSSQFKLITWYH